MPDVDQDGFGYHPRSEDELRALVVYAYEHGLKLRVRGSCHSVRRAIYPDDGAPGAIVVMLDRYRDVTITPDPADPTQALVEVEAGCHLGKDPYDDAGTSRWENSLNWQLQRRGYALPDLGGVSHQTLAGFLLTGSSGGSTQHEIYSTIERIRFIDGTGVVHDVRRDDPDPARRDLFFAAGVSLGLLGVISKLWLRVGPTFHIVGRQVTSSTDDAEVDLFGDGERGKPSLEAHLRRTPYTRLMWWPQRGFDRIQIWQAAPVEPAPDFEPNPYEELGRAPRLASLAGSLLYTILGNLDDVSAVPGKLGPWFDQLEADVEGLDDENACRRVHAGDAGQRYTLDDVLGLLRGRFDRVAAARPKARGPEDSKLGDAIAALARKLLEGAFGGAGAQLLAGWLQRTMPYLIDDILAAFVEDGTQDFQDTWMCGLPMDNQMDDRLWATEFTELWIPIDQAGEAMRRLRAYFAGDGDPQVAYARTGPFSCELYGAGASPFWMSPSYGTAALRLNVFWFALNAGDPEVDFFPQFWQLLGDLGFRPHWGKHLPPPSETRRAAMRALHPKLDDFLALRGVLDPKQIFVSRYWRDHLGIEPPAAPGPLAAPPEGAM